MNKENKSNSKVMKEIRLNINYLDFISRIKKEKLEEVNKEKIESVYNEEMGLVFNNVKRVSSRVKRSMLSEVLKRECEKRNLSIEEFKKIDSKVIRESKERNNNYVSVKI